MKEVNINRNEQRGLMMLRNELISYIANDELPNQIRKNMETASNLRNDFPAPVLPEPINHHSACSSCAYNLICSSFLSRDEMTVLPDKHPLMQLQQQLPQLTSDHIDYFIKWNGYIALEEEQMRNGMKFRCLLFSGDSESNKLNFYYRKSSKTHVAAYSRNQNSQRTVDNGLDSFRRSY